MLLLLIVILLVVQLFFQDTNDYDYNQFRLKENVLIFEISIAVIIIFIGSKTLVVSGNIIIKFVMGLEMIYYRPLNDILQTVLVTLFSFILNKSKIII